MASVEEPPNPSSSASRYWLSRYASRYHAWAEAKGHLYRPLGLVESSFDNDGALYEGRADINVLLEFDVSSRLTREQLRDRITLAWTALRLRHVLLAATAVSRQPYMHSEIQQRYFVIKPPGNVEEAIAAAKEHIVFTEDFYTDIDALDFYKHAKNVGRVINPERALGKFFVLPAGRMTSNFKLRFLLVIAHQISDGVTNIVWTKSFLELLNKPLADLHAEIATSARSASFWGRLPSPQEDLYPIISGNLARQRWYWAITRVLRHVRHPLPPAFENPLHRDKKLERPVPLFPKYSALLDYTRTPPLMSSACQVYLSKRASARLQRLCRSAGVSVGAGSFALVAMVQMEMQERRYPNIALTSRPPYIGAFPINARPFLQSVEPPNTIMLAFSDGVVLSHLSSALSVEGRFRLLARQAHRQLSIYQKRPKQVEDPRPSHMDSKGAGRVLSFLFLYMTERVWRSLPTHMQTPDRRIDPQGELPMRPNPTMATNGISSIGRLGIAPGAYDLSQSMEDKGVDAFAADFASILQNVRARDGEFLVGIQGSHDGIISANVSIDSSTHDPSRVEEWKARMESILGEDSVSKL